MWLQEMGVVFVVSMPFTVSLFDCAMIDHSDFTNLHSKCTSSTVILLPHLHLSVCCVRREIWCATRHAWLRVWSEGIRLTLVHATLLTLATICSSLRATEWFECTMHIACIHFVVTPLVCIHQEWWVLEHEVRVVEQSICVSRCWCLSCLKPVITTWNDAASSCEE